MTDNFKRFENENDVGNAFREGWQAACNLHLRRPQGPGFGNAWLQSDAFTRMPEDDQANDRWIPTTDAQQDKINER
jgi:hypothetical protein